ncbi:MAG: ABC transporter permease [Anaerolineae bacterium]|nr:ABC transporter permease [Candidatus Roseilinea sp.]MDW8449030.1 ABC transporter permease [Anaerolineae bacterium]
MSKTLLIAWHEFKRHVFRRRFIGILLMPLIILAVATVVGFISASAAARFETGTVGYVDPAGVLPQAANPPDSSFTFTRFDDETSARAALEQQEITAYLVLAPDFLTSGDVRLIYWEDEPSNSDLRRAFERYRNAHLLAGRPASVAQRVLEGSRFSFETPDRARAMRDDDIPSFLLPLVFTMLFITAAFGGSQYFMQAVLDEKENRTMEVLITSVTPTQLMAGKVFGLSAVGLLQMAIWSIAAFVALSVLQPRLPFLQNVSLEPGFIALALAMFTLYYVMLGALLAAVGSMVVDAKQGQNYASPVMLIAMIPLFFLVVILFDPNGVFSVILSLIPLTSPLTLLMRYGMVSVPAWQIILALMLIAAGAAGAIWLAGRVFRIGMLRFDKGVKWSELVASIRF